MTLLRPRPLVVCAHCRKRDDSVRLRRVPLLGFRPICDPCAEALDKMGYGLA